MAPETEFSQYVKSDKIPCNIYAERKSSSKKSDGRANNLKNSSTTKLGEY